MHNVQLLDPMNRYTKALKEITAKKTKTEADIIELRWREFMGGLYFDEKGPYVPSEWIESVLRDGGKVNRQGKNFSAALFTEEDRYYLDLSPQKWVDGKTWYGNGGSDYRPVVVAGKKVMRCRPIFKNWALTFAVAYNDTVLSKDTVFEAAMNAGLLKGLGDYRPKFGRFVVEEGYPREIA